MIRGEAEVDAMVDLSVTTRLNFSRPESELKPWMSGSVTPQDAPIYRGLPMVAPLWVRASPLVSSTGEFVSSNRPDPDEVEVGSDIRFIASTDYWDPVTGNWSPITSTQVDWFFTSAPLTAPDLTDITYSIGKERITRTALNFDPGDFLASSFNSGIDDAVAYSVGIVLGVRQGDGDEVVLDTGTLAGPDAQPVRVCLSVSDKVNYQWGTAEGKVDQVVPISRYEPFTLLMVVSPPTVTVYYSAGSKYLISNTSRGQFLTTAMQFLLGKSASYDTRIGAVMNVYEVDFWSRALTQSEVITAVSRLASTYGESYGQS